MSYDLNFWRYKPGVSLDNQETYELLSDGQNVDGVEDIPIAEIKKRVSEEFAKKRWEKLDGLTTAVCIGIVLIFMLGFSPDYVAWLMD